MLHRLYSTLWGRCLLKIFTAPAFSKIAGAFLSTSVSKLLINPFIRKNSIDMSDYKVENWSSFNDFFCRNLRVGAREPVMRQNALIAPCDGYLTVYNITPYSTFEIKNTSYTVNDLIENEHLAKEYDEGLCLVFRLTPSDYHRYIYPDSGAKSKNIKIPGVLHTVQPVALESCNVFKTNSREYSLLHTNNFDEIVFMEVGAMLVGKIKNYHDDYTFKRGEEKGRFEFGGSTIIMLIKKDVALIDTTIKEESNNGKEYKVKLGQQIGVRI